MLQKSLQDDKKDDINFSIWLLIISFVSSNFSNKNRKGNGPSGATEERKLPFWNTWGKASRPFSGVWHNPRQNP
jgi:hypothetical protein